MQARKDHLQQPEESIELRLQRSDDRLRNLIALSSDWYWEQDENFRFTLFMGEAIERSGLDYQALLGTTRWDQGAIPLGDDGRWDAHRALLAAHRPFSDFIYQKLDEQHLPRYISVSGRPVFAADGRFTGYRGIAKDVTTRVQIERRLAIEHAAARVLAESHDMAEAVPRILRAVCETLHWECGVRWELDARIGVLRCAETWSNGSAGAGRLIESMQRTPAPLPTAGDGRPVPARPETRWVHDLAKEPEFPHAAAARKAGLGSAFMFPIRAGAQVIGVLAFFSRSIHRPDGELLESTSYIGNEIGQFWLRTRAEERLREIGDRFQSLTELSSDWYWEQDENFRFTERTGGSPASAAFRGDEARGKTRWELPYIDVTDAQWAEHKALLAAHKPFRDFVLKRRLDDGSIRYVSISGRPFFDDNGRFRGYRGIGKDITEQRNAEERIQYLASHDGLTALPNRVMFNEILNVAIHSARRYQRGFALLFIDLDRFKNINDTFGHDAGDTLLKEIATRLKQVLRASDVVARLGGDEFVVLVQEISEQAHVSGVARKVLSAIIRPLVLLGQECRVTASIGVSLFPADGQDEQALMKNADIAMYRAKEEGKNNFKFYSEALNVHSLERMALETSLRRALERNEFFLHYQAKLDLNSGRITGTEALLRWQHPELGVVAPAKFIPLAEETGLIVPIGKWVLKTACEQSMAWQRAGLPPLCMAVNLSPRQFADEDLLSDIASVLERTGMNPELLELEITESMMMHDPERVIRVLAAMKAMGLRLAIDDFGTGYSSLAQIKRFPIDTLKVDRSFIREIPADAEDRAITEAIIAMGKTLSLTVVAEGVETPAQQQFLREHACDEMQGYYFSKPVSAEQFAEFLRQHLAAPKPL